MFVILELDEWGGGLPHLQPELIQQEQEEPDSLQMCSPAGQISQTKTAP